MDETATPAQPQETAQSQATTQAQGAAAPAKEVIIAVKDVVVAFGEKRILNGLSLDIYRGEILGFIGPSGAGKSVLTRTILGLNKKQAGTINVLGHDLDTLNDVQHRAVERRWGVLFQQGALFSSLNCRQNVQVPMREYLKLSQKLMDELAAMKFEMVGLTPDVGDKLPSELSGGMIKRVALARALALDPDILFLDEPTSGLDPIGAGDFDDLIATLQKTLGLTVFMVTHDLGSLYSVCDRIAALGQGKIVEQGTIKTMLASEQPWVKTYFHGKRAEAMNAAV